MYAKYNWHLTESGFHLSAAEKEVKQPRLVSILERWLTLISDSLWNFSRDPVLWNTTLCHINYI